MRRIGIGVGGTSTDGTRWRYDRVLHAVETPTTEDVLTGVRTAHGSAAAHRAKQGDAGGDDRRYAAVMRWGASGETSRRSAHYCGSTPASRSSPFCDWPEDAAPSCRAGAWWRAGMIMTAVRSARWTDAALPGQRARWKAAGIHCVAINGIFCAG